MNSKKESYLTLKDELLECITSKSPILNTEDVYPLLLEMAVSMGMFGLRHKEIGAQRVRDKVEKQIQLNKDFSLSKEKESQNDQ